MSLESAEERVKDRSREKVDPWNFPIQYLKGVGAKIAELLESQSFHSLWDILFFLPRDYQDRRKLASYEELLEAARNGDAMMSKGKLEKYFMRYSPRSRRRWMEAKVSVKQEQNGCPAEVQFLWFQKQL